MTTNDIDAIRKLTDATTPGPWEAEGEIVQVVGEVRYICDVFGLADKWPTAEFIAAARTHVPALCDEIEHLRRERDTVVATAKAYLDEVERLRGRVRQAEREAGYARRERDGYRQVVDAATAWRQMRRDMRTTPAQDSEALIKAVDDLQTGAAVSR